MGLPDLPAELVEGIAGYLASPRDLAAWSRTSRRFHGALEGPLYSFVLLRGGRARAALGRAVAARPPLAALVRTLYVNGDTNFGRREKEGRPPHGEGGGGGGGELALASLTNLEKLYLHFPAVGEQDRLVELFEQFPTGAVLPSLKQCSLFIWDHRRYKYYSDWELDRYWKVFLHPGLEALTVHASAFRWDVSQGDGGAAALIRRLRGTGRLRRLHLYGSRLSLPLLCHLLLVPRALEELVHEAPSFEPWLDRAASAEAMRRLPPSARRSLRRLTFLHRDHPFFIRWSPLERLERLRVYAHHVLLRGGAGRLREAAPALADLLPPTLEVLALCDVSFYDGDGAVPEALLHLARLVGAAGPAGCRLRRVELELSDHSHAVPRAVADAFEAVGVQLVFDRRFSEDEFRWGGKDDWPQDPPIWLED